MEYEKILEKINGKKGQFCSISWSRPMKTKKEFTNYKVVKHTYGTALRLGVNYDNMASTIKGREDGTKPAVNVGLIGRSWVLPNVMMRSDKSGKYLLRVSMAQNSKFNTKFTIDGREVDRSEVEKMVYKNEIGSHETNVFDVNIDNIESIMQVK